MEIPRNHRLRHALYRLEGTACPACGEKQFPAARRCACGEKNLQPFRFSGRGRLFSFSEIFVAPSGFRGPYTVGLVDLEEGVRLLAQLTDLEPDEPRVGMPVEMVVRRLTADGPDGVILYGYKFRPVLEAPVP